MLAQILLIPKSSYLSRFEALCNSSLKTFLNWLPCFLVVFFLLVGMEVGWGVCICVWSVSTTAITSREQCLGMELV